MWTGKPSNGSNQNCLEDSPKIKQLSSYYNSKYGDKLLNSHSHSIPIKELNATNQSTKRTLIHLKKANP